MDTDTLTPTVSANISEEMKKAGENLSSMERATGFSRSKLRLRLGGKSPWSTREMCIMAAHFGITTDELMTKRVAA